MDSTDQYWETPEGLMDGIDLEKYIIHICSYQKKVREKKDIDLKKYIK